MDELGVGALIVLAGSLIRWVAKTWYDRPICSVCGEKDMDCTPCIVCSAHVCSSDRCRTRVHRVVEDRLVIDKGGVVCKRHISAYTEKLNKKYEIARKSTRVRLIPESYRGTIDIPLIGKLIESDAFKDADLAKRWLKYKAAELGAATVTEFSCSLVSNGGRVDGWVAKGKI